MAKPKMVTRRQGRSSQKATSRNSHIFSGPYSARYTSNAVEILQTGPVCKTAEAREGGAACSADPSAPGASPDDTNEAALPIGGPGIPESQTRESAAHGESLWEYTPSARISPRQNSRGPAPAGMYWPQEQPGQPGSRHPGRQNPGQQIAPVPVPLLDPDPQARRRSRGTGRLRLL